MNGSIFGTTISTDWPSHGFTGSIYTKNLDGSSQRIISTFPAYSQDPVQPNSVILHKAYLYGTTVSGGRSNLGTLFCVHTNGSDFRVLKEFGEGTDGANPRARLTIIGDSLYGVCSGGIGTIFKIRTDGTGYTVLHRFDSIPWDGYRPHGQPVLFNGYLYGTTINGGESSNGALYRVKPDGTEYQVVKSFFAVDGVHPIELTQAGDSLYGTCFFGGILPWPQGLGTLFKVDSKSGTQPVLNFSSTFAPVGRLLAVGDVLYGAAFSKSAFSQPGLEGRLNPFDEGQIISIQQGQTNAIVLASLNGILRGDVSANGLVLSGNKLVGTLRGTTGSALDHSDTLQLTKAEGPETSAAIFWLNTNGTQAASVYRFGPTHNGTLLNGDLVIDGDVLYGTAHAGGEAGGGTIFRLDLRPRILIAPSTNSVRVSWPIFAGVTNLQFTTNLSNWHTLIAEIREDESRFSVDIPTTNVAAAVKLAVPANRE
jgi:uncharacterized repeat protein (TIGR03803 family)